jgi:intracellular septation protein A
MPTTVLVAMRITKVILWAYDKRAELSACVTVVMVLTIGALTKLDAAILLFHRGH